MSDRRTFLSGLASLPLIGGGVSLIGKPTGAAVPVTPLLLDNYSMWLFYERAWLLWERHGQGYRDQDMRLEVVWHNPASGELFDCIPVRMPARRFDHTDAASRAAVVLSAAGVPISGAL